jgi:hypothetical protein
MVLFFTGFFFFEEVFTGSFVSFRYCKNGTASHTTIWCPIHVRRTILPHVVALLPPTVGLCFLICIAESEVEAVYLHIFLHGAVDLTVSMISISSSWASHTTIY